MAEAAAMKLDAPCEHDWQHCLTPADSLSPWYRCSKCGVFGYCRRRARTKFFKRSIVAYKCENKGCNEPAIDRLPGRGSRLTYRWRCRRCLDNERNERNAD